MDGKRRGRVTSEPVVGGSNPSGGATIQRMSSGSPLLVAAYQVLSIGPSRPTGNRQCVGRAFERPDDRFHGPLSRPTTVCLVDVQRDSNPAVAESLAGHLTTWALSFGQRGKRRGCRE